uniref:nucleolar pre-ribosomal-associated protein 1-like n=1 Tax=Styela clava TaxID=7725 RepID=UPI0019398826|nr:nucleolar pre-ribosomal-associated protein 1-like [Styela clava]
MKHKINIEEGNDKNVETKRSKPSENKTNLNKKHEPFTSLEFKNLLKEPDTRFQGLKRFSSACEHYVPSDKNGVDIVRAYISSSPDCLEIFKCFGSHSSSDELAAIFRSLLHILTRTAGDLKELYGKVGFNICGSLIQSHLQKIYHALGLRQSPRTVSLTLKMLTMMVMQNKDAANEVANNLDFSLRCFKDVLNKLKGKLGYEIRVAYIRFVLSFFMANDVNTSRKILETQGLIAVIFKSLKYDSASTVQLVLTTLKEKAIENILIPKTAKVRFLAEPKVLVNIAALFQWDGVVDIVSESESDIKEYVRKITYEFLYNCCCPFKYGINFKDRTLGIGTKSKNHVLLDFVTILLSSTTDQLICDLIIEILKACPDLLPRVMADYRISLEPKLSETWLMNCKLTKRIYEAQPDIASALIQATSNKSDFSQENDKIMIQDFVKMAVNGLFSVNYTTTVLRHCLKHKSAEIKIKSLELMLSFLQKTQASIKFISEKENWSTTIYSTDELEMFLTGLQETLFKTFISVQLITSTWKECCEENTLDTKSIILKILFLLRDIFPDMITESKFDLTKLLFGINISETEDEENVLILKMLSSAPHEHKWFKVVEKGQSPFRRLIQIIYDCKNHVSGTCKEAILLFKRVLVADKILKENESSESEIWIQSLILKLREHNDFIVLNYIHDICSLVVRKPVHYNSLLASFEQMGMNNTSETKPVVEKDRKFWESIPDVVIESHNSESVETSQKSVFIASHNHTEKLYDDADNIDLGNGEQKMSLFGIAALDHLKSCHSFGSEEKATLDSYLSTVMIGLFHSVKSFKDAQRFVRVFKALTKDVDEFDSTFSGLANFKTFLSIWLSSESGNFVPNEKNIESFVQGWFWQSYKIKKNLKKLKLLEKIKSWVSEIHGSGNYVPEVEIYQFKCLVQQLLLYFDTLCGFEKEGCTLPTNSMKEILYSILFLLREASEFYSENQVNITKTGFSNNSMEVNCPSKSVTNQPEKLFLWKLFLDCSSMKNLFFDDIYLSKYDFDYTRIDFENLMKKDLSLQQICTSVTCDAIKDYHDLFVKADSTSVNFYISKICKLIVILLKELSLTKLKKDPEYLILESFTTLQPVISASHLCKILAEVSKLLQNLNSKSNVRVFSTVICQCLQGILADKNKINCLQESVKELFEFLTSKYLKDKSRIIELFVQLLEFHPHFAFCGSADVINLCMKNLDLETVDLMTKLIQYNPMLLTHWCKETNLSKLNEEKKLSLIPVINQVLSTFLPNNDEFSKMKCAEILNSYKSLIFVPIEEFSNRFDDIISTKMGKQFMEHIFTIATALGEENLYKPLLDSILNLENTTNINLDIVLSIGQLLQKVISKPELYQIHASEIYLCVHYIVSQPKSQSETDRGFETLLQKIQYSDVEEYPTICGKLSSIWDKFLKQTLKHHFENATALICLLHFVKMFYADDGKIQEYVTVNNITDIPTFKYMLTNHSKFFAIILEEDADSVQMKDDKVNLKLVVLQLLFELCVRCDRNDLSDKDLGFLFGAYGCTLTQTDQTILTIILLFEQKGVSLSEYKPFLWAKAALSSYRARRNLGDTLWKKPSPSDILTCLDNDIMEATYARFPLRRRMLNISSDVKNVDYFENDPKVTISTSENKIYETQESTQNVYDPSFLLPALLDLLGPENLLDCKMFVRSGALSFLMCCLASHCPMVRSLAASCLSLYYQHAITAWFPEKNLTLYLIRCVRNGMEIKTDGDIDAIPRLSSVVANFLSTVVRLHQTPDNHMFSVLHRFILIKPQLDLKNVPEFYVLFFSAEMESKTERTWILNLVIEGIRDMGDYHIIKKKNVFQLLMCLHDSPVSDNYVRRQIFQIFEQACTIRSVANDLIRNNGLITWLTTATKQQASANLGVIKTYPCLGDPGKRQENTTHVVRVLCMIWKTLNVNEFIASEKMDQVVACTQDTPEEDKTLPIIEKRAALAPFRVVKQLITLSISLLGNMFSMIEHASNDTLFSEMSTFFTDTLSVLESCLSNLSERRKNSILRNKDQQQTLEDSCDLQKEDVRVLLAIAELETNFESNDIIIHLVNILMFWTPQFYKVEEIKDQDSELWLRCAKWVFGKALKVCIDDRNWFEKHFIRVLKWVQTWVAFDKIDSQMMDLLHHCYDIICNRFDELGESKKDCLVILNRILNSGVESDSREDGTYLNVLLKMQNIREGCDQIGSHWI